MRQTWQVETEGRHLLTEATVVDSSPTVPMRQLAGALRRHREATGMSQEEAGRWIDVSESQMSKFETADRKIKVAYVRSLCQLYDVDAAEAAFLVNLARQSDQRGWWVEYRDTIPKWFEDYLGMETAADEISTYESELVPGLLQTREYIEVVASGSASGQAADRAFELRATRQRRLTDEQPLRLRAVLNEAVLRRDVGGPAVMLGQIRHLLDMAESPNVSLQVLPFSVGFHPAMTGPFAGLAFSDLPNLVYVEMKGAASYMEKPADVERYAATFQQLTELALASEETKAFLRDEIERRSQ